MAAQRCLDDHMTPESDIPETPDQRERVTDIAGTIFEAVCLLTIHCGTTALGGTGVLCDVEGTPTLVTAGHNVRPTIGAERVVTPASHIDMEFGKTDADTRVTKLTVLGTDFSMSGEYHTETGRHDWAVVSLANFASKLPKQMFHLPLKMPTEDHGKPLTMAGYPAYPNDNPRPGVPGYPRNSLWKCRLDPLYLTPHHIGYQDWTSRGTSGAPVFYSGSDGRHYVVGIHVGHSLALNMNCAVLISEIYPACTQVLSQILAPLSCSKVSQSDTVITAAPGTISESVLRIKTRFGSDTVIGSACICEYDGRFIILTMSSLIARYLNGRLCYADTISVCLPTTCVSANPAEKVDIPLFSFVVKPDDMLDGLCFCYLSDTEISAPTVTFSVDGHSAGAIPQTAIQSVGYSNSTTDKRLFSSRCTITGQMATHILYRTQSPTSMPLGAVLLCEENNNFHLIGMKADASNDIALAVQYALGKLQRLHGFGMAEQNIQLPDSCQPCYINTHSHGHIALCSDERVCITTLPDVSTAKNISSDWGKGAINGLKCIVVAKACPWLVGGSLVMHSGRLFIYTENKAQTRLFCKLNCQEITVFDVSPESVFAVTRDKMFKFSKEGEVVKWHPIAAQYTHIIHYAQDTLLLCGETSVRLRSDFVTVLWQRCFAEDHKACSYSRVPHRDEIVFLLQSLGSKNIHVASLDKGYTKLVIQLDESYTNALVHVCALRDGVVVMYRQPSKHLELLSYGNQHRCCDNHQQLASQDEIVRRILELDYASRVEVISETILVHVSNEETKQTLQRKLTDALLEANVVFDTRNIRFCVLPMEGTSEEHTGKELVIQFLDEKKVNTFCGFFMTNQASDLCIVTAVHRRLGVPFVKLQFPKGEVELVKCYSVFHCDDADGNFPQRDTAVLELTAAQAEKFMEGYYRDHCELTFSHSLEYGEDVKFHKAHGRTHGKYFSKLITKFATFHGVVSEKQTRLLEGDSGCLATVKGADQWLEALGVGLLQCTDELVTVESYRHILDIQPGMYLSYVLDIQHAVDSIKQAFGIELTIPEKQYHGIPERQRLRTGIDALPSQVTNMSLQDDANIIEPNDDVEMVSEPASLETAHRLDKLADSHVMAQKYSEALQCYGTSLEIKRQLLADPDPDIAASLYNIGHTYECLGIHHIALTHHHDCLAMRCELYPDPHIDVASSLNSVGLTYWCMGKYETAMSYYEQSLEELRLA